VFVIRVAIVSTRLPEPWSGLVDDAAIFPPGNASLDAAVKAHADYRSDWYAAMVGPLVVSDVRLPDLLEILDDATEALAVSVVLTGGAGSVVPAAKWATGSGQLKLRAVETVLRDPDDLSGNVRRVAAAVDAARAEGAMADDVPVYVELPHVGSTGSWMAAADTVAESGFRLKFRTGGAEEHLFPAAHALASWIGAALDRETPFKCTAGLHRAVRHTDSETGFTHHGFLNILLATRASLDGGAVPEVAELLELRDDDEVVSRLRDHGDGVLTRTRRWFTSFGSCSVLEPLEDLIDLGLLEPPA
jgi:hypothetical protein